MSKPSNHQLLTPHRSTANSKGRTYATTCPEKTERQTITDPETQVEVEIWRIVGRWLLIETEVLDVETGPVRVEALRLDPDVLIISPVGEPVAD